MTFQGDHQNIVSGRGGAADGLVSVALSTTALKDLASTARIGLAWRARALTLPEHCPRNFGSEMPKAMARCSFFWAVGDLLIVRFIFRDLFFFCDKSALLCLCFPYGGQSSDVLGQPGGAETVPQLWGLQPVCCFTKPL
jgi:hypothetical protein